MDAHALRVKNEALVRYKYYGAMQSHCSFYCYFPHWESRFT